MQTPAATYAVENTQESRQAWLPPRLRVQSIAAITQSGTGTPLDGCDNIACTPGRN